METIFDLSAEPYKEWPLAIIPMLFFLYSFQQRFLSIKRQWPIWSLVFSFVTAALTGYRPETIQSRWVWPIQHPGRAYLQWARLWVLPQHLYLLSSSHGLLRYI